MKISTAILLMRPAEWLKNLFVFLPLFFGGYLCDGPKWLSAIVAFAAFSAAASAVYCINGIADRNADRLHPYKRHRPLACGQARPAGAIALAAALLAVSAATALLSGNTEVLGVLAVYFTLNIAYTLVLKRVAIVDVCVIAFGFVLRVMAGGFADNIPLSPWIILMTFLLTLFLAFAKRRDDLVLNNRGHKVTRSTDLGYTTPFLDAALGITAAMTAVCYILYTVSGEVCERLGSHHIYISAAFVIAGILRYLRITIIDKASGSPTRVLMHDRIIQLCLLCWTAFFVIVIYLR